MISVRAVNFFCFQRYNAVIEFRLLDHNLTVRAVSFEVFVTVIGKNFSTVR